jgi:hypothetical protein
LGGCAPQEASIESSFDVCRWLAYAGSPLRLEELLYGTDNSLVVQGLHSRMGAEETNGDGFGVGWYGDRETPAVFRSVEPAWNELPESSWGVIQPGDDELHPFTPIAVHADEAASG